MSPDGPSLVVELLSLCARMEQLVAELYRELATQQSRRSDLCKLWSKTAREEDTHAAQFERALAMDGEVGGLQVGLEEVEALVGRIRETLERVRRVRPSPVDSLRLAIKLERDMAQMHLTSVATFSQPSIQRLFEGMARADQGHVEALEEQLRVELAGRSSSA